MDESYEEALERYTLQRLALKKNKPPHPAETPTTNSRVGLLSLPSELLDRIIDCLNDANHDELNFKFDRRQNFALFEDEPGIRTIYKLRLVCKRLCDIASRIFMPFFRICLSDSSLTRAEEIIQNRRISQNIRGIELLLDYRPGSLANDFELFFNTKTDEILDLQELWYQTKTELIGGQYKDWAPEALDKEAKQIFDIEIKDIPIIEDPDMDFYYPMYLHRVLAFERWQTVRAAWNEEQNNTEEEYTRDDPKRELLREGFRRFQAIHKAQHQLISSGEFTSRVSAICASLPNLQFLIFSDRDFSERGIEQEWVDMKSHTMFDDQMMLELLSGPVTWSQTASDDTSASTPVHITTSTLIWDIPTTLYQAGFRLHGLIVRGFSLPRNHAADETDDEDGNDGMSLSNPDCENALIRLKQFYTSTERKMPTILRMNTIHNTLY